MFNFFRKNKRAISFGAVFVLGVVVGVLVMYGLRPTKIIPTTSIREHTDKYRFIRPLLAIDRSYDAVLPAYQSLDSGIKNKIKNDVSSGKIEKASVYFIDYDKGGSFNVNKDEKYAPASLLKVIIMLAYFKKSESTPGLFNQDFIYHANVSKYLNEIPFMEPTKLKIGEKYGVRKLIDEMIINSDNGAMDVLLANISDEYLNQVYKDLGLEGPTDDPSNIYTISIKDYSLFFRVLFNATYLTPENSEEALSILSRANFDKGLTRNLPKDLEVAHKFGEHVEGQGERVNSIELHDCGIIYYPQNPYLLCVMTRGSNIENLYDFISSISKKTYDYVGAEAKK